MTLSSKAIILTASLVACCYLGYMAYATRCPRAREICVVGIIMEVTIALVFISR